MISIASSRLLHVIHVFVILAAFLLPGCQPAAPDSTHTGPTEVEAAPAHTGEVVQHYPGGQVSRRFNEINGKKEGLMTDFYQTGEKMSERIFENDQQTGRTVIYYQSGAVKEVQYYQKGLRQGGDTTFYENGKPQFVLTLRDNKKHGYVRKWAPEGSLTFEAKYQNDTLVEVKGKKITPQHKPSTDSLK